jgi:hypothetical protein
MSNIHKNRVNLALTNKNIEQLTKELREEYNQLNNENRNISEEIYIIRGLQNIYKENQHKRFKTKQRLKTIHNKANGMAAAEEAKQLSQFEELRYKGSMSYKLIDEINNESTLNSPNMVKHNCFIMGHGSTIHNEYIIIPENINLKFYTPKGKPLLGYESSKALLNYSENPNTEFETEKHYLLGDSITHNMYIKLLSIFKYQKEKNSENYFFGDCLESEYNSIHIFSHSGFVIGKKLISFNDIKKNEYEKMGIRLLKLTITEFSRRRSNEKKYKILDFGDHIYGIIDEVNDYIIIINTQTNKSNPNHLYYKDLVKIALEEEFAKHHHYRNSSQYNPKMRLKVKELIHNLTFPSTITENALQKMIYLSFYNHIKREVNSKKSIISFQTIKRRNFNINLGEVFNYILDYNENNRDKIRLCQGLICRSWDKKKNSLLDEEKNVANVSLENNIGYAKLTRQVSNSEDYKMRFRNILSRCNTNITKLESNNQIVLEYKKILRFYQIHHYLSIKNINFLVNLANDYLNNVELMKNRNLSKRMLEMEAEAERFVEEELPTEGSFENLFTHEKTKNAVRNNRGIGKGKGKGNRNGNGTNL